MKAMIITFDISSKGVSRKKIVELHRKLYGYKDYSQYGKYEYERHGLLSNIPHINPNQSVIVVRKKDADKVINLIEKYTNKIFAREVTLRKGELG